MISIRSASTVSLLLLACTPDPLPADEADTLADTDDSGTDTGGECPSSESYGGYADWSVAIDGSELGLNESHDLTLSCTTVDDGDDSTLSLDCGDMTFGLTWLPVEWSEAIVDVAGASVQVRLVYIVQWGYADQWLRLDFVGEDLSVFLIAAENLSTLEWFNPWGLAVGQECQAPSGLTEFFTQTLVFERDGQTLELWPGETGQIGDQLEVWVHQSVRAPGSEHAQGWKELEIVSRGHLAPSEVCEQDADACGPGLACCYPCGISDCDHVCQAVDPETEECPPPPP